jgi:16S rRNA (guanine1207-N2)-methyltransferase
LSQAGRRALIHAFESGALVQQRAFFLRAEVLPFSDVDCEQSNRPEFLKLKRASPRLEGGSYPLGLMLMTKHKEESFANIARGWAMLADGGRLAIAGANEDGAASLEKHVAKAFTLCGSLSKFHCRVFWFAKSDKAPPAYWQGLACLQPVGDGSWLSRPGIFSWDRIDDGSELLARHLPGDLSGRVAEFGCGWGYLARVTLARSPNIHQIDLIDAEHLALDAARANLNDARASFHWLDLTSEPVPAAYEAIVCNPPFHIGRASTPSLGQKMIEAASRALKPGGRFFMVANRGLPYEPLLKSHFSSFIVLADNNKFRVTRAVR